MSFNVVETLVSSSNKLADDYIMFVKSVLIAVRIAEKPEVPFRTMRSLRFSVADVEEYGSSMVSAEIVENN